VALGDPLDRGRGTTFLFLSPGWEPFEPAQSLRPN
jgi:hypothetical protein